MLTVSSFICFSLLHASHHLPFSHISVPCLRCKLSTRTNSGARREGTRMGRRKERRERKRRRRVGPRVQKAEIPPQVSGPELEREADGELGGGRSHCLRWNWKVQERVHFLRGKGRRAPVLVSGSRYQVKTGPREGGQAPPSLSGPPPACTCASSGLIRNDWALFAETWLWLFIHKWAAHYSRS